MTLPTTPKFVTVAQAAQQLGKTRPTVYAMVARQELTAEQVAGRMLIHADSVLAYLAHVPASTPSGAPR